MKKNILLLLIFLTMILSLQGQTVEKMKFQAFVTGDYSKWEQVANHIRNNYDLKQTSNVEELVHCYYALASSLIAKKKKTEAEKVIDLGESLVDKLLANNPNNALALCYKGDFLGYRIGMNKLKAVTLGSKSRSCVEKALKLAPNNPQILFDYGNLLYYPPKMFGGNKAQALKYYQKAISIYEKQNKTTNNWIYLQLFVVQGHCYELLGNDQLAEQSYLKVLKIAPNLNVVKNDLYPKLKSRMNGESTLKASERDFSL